MQTCVHPFALLKSAKAFLAFMSVRACAREPAKCAFRAPSMLPLHFVEGAQSH
jgi:hypothetical protein